MENRVRKIIFSDSASDSGRSDDALFIAMNPRTRSYLIKSGIEAHDTLRYFQEGSRIAVLEKSKILTDWLENKIDSYDRKDDLADVYKDWFIFLTRFSINYCLWSIEIILNAVEEHRPDEIGASSSSKRSVHSTVYIESDDGYLGRIANMAARQKNLKCENILAGPIPNNVRPLASYILKAMSFRLWEKYILADKISHKRRDALLFTTKLYKMDRLAEALRDRIGSGSTYFLKGPVIPSFELPGLFINIFWRRHSKKIAAQKAFYKELASLITKEKDLFSYRDIPFAEVILEKIQRNIAPYVVGQSLWSGELGRFIDSLRPKAILLSGNRTDDSLLAKISQQKNIMTIFVSHGSCVSPKNEYEYIEWGEHGRAFLRGSYTYHALQSPLAEGYLKTFPTSGKPIKAGPLIWGMPINLERSRALFKKLFCDRYNLGDIKVVLHAGTSKASSVLRFHIYETPDEYIQALRELANAVEKMPDTALIIRFRPMSEIGIDDIKALVPFSRKVILSVEEPFLDVLGMSDLLVSFSSTTIEEALQNRIPVLLYGGGGRYQHISAREVDSDSPLAGSAAYHVSDTKDLPNALGSILYMDKKQIGGDDLFAPYIYAPAARASLADLLNVKVMPR